MRVDDVGPTQGGAGLRKAHAACARTSRRPAGRGLHSFTSRLNLSAVYGIGGARRDCVARAKGVFMVCRVLLCVKRVSS